MDEMTGRSPDSSRAGRTGRKTSVYLTHAQAARMDELGATLAEVVRAGLHALADQGAGPLVVTLQPDGRYQMRREAREGETR